MNIMEKRKNFEMYNIVTFLNLTKWRQNENHFFPFEKLLHVAWMHFFFTSLRFIRLDIFGIFFHIQNDNGFVYIKRNRKKSFRIKWWKSVNKKWKEKKARQNRKKKHHKFVMASGPRNCSFVLKKKCLQVFFYSRSLG